MKKTGVLVEVSTKFREVLTIFGEDKGLLRVESAYYYYSAFTLYNMLNRHLNMVHLTLGRLSLRIFANKCPNV